MEESYPNIIMYAAPFLIFFAALEVFLAWYQEREYHDRKEVVTSVIVGLVNVAINLALKTLMLFPVVWVYNLVPWRMELNWWMLIPCYIIFDFASYWAHRISHGSRFWWATHVLHHSSDHYNLTVSFRLSWVQGIKLIFFLPVMLFGFHPVIFFVTNQIAVLFQFWVHTEYIKKLPKWVEYIFATPSNHRVHHGSQEQYIDKNYGATFIFWDRMLGTYEPEVEKPKYGITTPLKNKYNPIYVNFHEYIDIVDDVKKAKTFKEKLYFVFGNPTKIAKKKIPKLLRQKKRKIKSQ
ncbi:sterol desaturase family protein [Niabella ginsengisoli]|uniref:Sterol desaturase family protein n=1 Tax=Niabella ginsengisoli TaxID=522298 RepID=A0ABS9SHT0_9BACT|nr:sterol desaturase family protein [Niabella ginsengisoli]MCH5597890.1 sterol desaturase family protein [Niabella ginsengisoli]